MKQPSPLFVWKLILVLILAAGVFMYIADPMKIVYKRREDQLSKRLSGIHFHKDEIGIIFFGDSMMDCALPVRALSLNTALTEEFRKNGGLGSRISAFEVTKGVSALKLLELADQMIEMRPSLIVIQSDVIVRRILKNRPRPKFTERVGNWSGVLALHMFGQSQPLREKKPGKELFLEKNNRPSVVGRPEKNECSLEQARQLWSNQPINTRDPAFIRGREFIHLVSSNGIRVVLVELPVSNTAAAFSTQQYLTKRSALLHSLSKDGVLHLTFPEVLPDDHFGDYSHVNYRGRRRFLNWFFPLLSEELVKE